MNVESIAHSGPVVVSRREELKVVVGASVGTVLEWYDFFLYGSLAVFFSGHFFPAGSATAGYLASLATLAWGCIIRPIGAVVFGAVRRQGRTQGDLPRDDRGDGTLHGRHRSLADFETIGWASPMLLVSLRMLQGLALGGEYGGAATYIAEHSRPQRRGFTTGFLQTTATFGFLLSLGITLLCRAFVWPKRSRPGDGVCRFSFPLSCSRFRPISGPRFPSRRCLPG